MTLRYVKRGDVILPDDHNAVRQAFIDLCDTVKAKSPGAPDVQAKCDEIKAKVETQARIVSEEDFVLASDHNIKREVLRIDIPALWELVSAYQAEFADKRSELIDKASLVSERKYGDFVLSEDHNSVISALELAQSQAEQVYIPPVIIEEKPEPLTLAEVCGDIPLTEYTAEHDESLFLSLSMTGNWTSEFVGNIIRIEKPPDTVVETTRKAACGYTGTGISMIDLITGEICKLVHGCCYSEGNVAARKVFTVPSTRILHSEDLIFDPAVTYTTDQLLAEFELNIPSPRLILSLVSIWADCYAYLAGAVYTTIALETDIAGEVTSSILGNRTDLGDKINSQTDISPLEVPTGTSLFRYTIRFLQGGHYHLRNCQIRVIDLGDLSLLSVPAYTSTLGGAWVEASDIVSETSPTLLTFESLKEDTVLFITKVAHELATGKFTIVGDPSYLVNAGYTWEAIWNHGWMISAKVLPPGTYEHKYYSTFVAMATGDTRTARYLPGYVIGRVE